MSRHKALNSCVQYENGQEADEAEAGRQSEKNGKGNDRHIYFMEWMEKYHAHT